MTIVLPMIYTPLFPVLITFIAGFVVVRVVARAIEIIIPG